MIAQLVPHAAGGRISICRRLREDQDAALKIFADVYALSARHPADANELVGSLERVAEFRGAELLPLAGVLRDWQGTPPSAWRTWRRHRLLDGVPSSFAEVLAGVIMFADPALTREAVGATWDPVTRSWASE